MTLKSTVRSVSFAVIISCILLALSSCLTMRLPKPKSEETALLIVKMDTKKWATMSFFSDYRLTIQGTGKNFLKVSPKFPYAFETDLPAGEYVFLQVTPTISTKQKRAGGVTKYEVPFVLEPGKVTIFPYSMFVELTQSRDPHDAGAPIQKYDMRRITATERTEILEEIKDFTNYTEWEALSTPME